MSLVCCNLQLSKTEMKRQGFVVKIRCYFLVHEHRNVAGLGFRELLKLRSAKLLGLFLHLPSLLLHMDLLHSSLRGLISSASSAGSQWRWLLHGCWICKLQLQPPNVYDLILPGSQLKISREEIPLQGQVLALKPVDPMIQIQLPEQRPVDRDGSSPKQRILVSWTVLANDQCQNQTDRKGKLGRSERVALTYIHYQM